MAKVRKWIGDFIASKAMSFCREGIRNLPERWQKTVTINAEGNISKIMGKNNADLSKNCDSR
uniref:DUF2256 domain-containing protein n=1 Tax=Heterorhabditis bacteriophora TaxID=37862 RepID=A0A1I7WR85_HETBA